MDLQENTTEVSPLEQVETNIKGFMNGDTKPCLSIIEDTSVEEFYEKLKTDLASDEFKEYKPSVESIPITPWQFEKLRGDMHIEGIEYKDGITALLINTTKAMIGVAAFGTGNKRISLLMERLTSQGIEDFRNLKPTSYEHQVIGS